VRLSPGDEKDTGVPEMPPPPLPPAGSAAAIALDTFADSTARFLRRMTQPVGVTLTHLLLKVQLAPDLHPFVRARLAADPRFVRSILKPGRVRLRTQAEAENARAAKAAQ
jgi:hypothetical protein